MKLEEKINELKKVVTALIQCVLEIVAPIHSRIGAVSEPASPAMSARMRALM